MNYIIFQSKSMQLNPIPMTEDMQNLLEFSEAMGVLKFVNNRTIQNFNLAFDPLITTPEYYHTLGKLQNIWNKLFFNISQNRKFISELMRPLRQGDLMVQHFIDIYDKTEGSNKHDGITFTRCDYYNDLTDNPKMTEYNLFSIGMQSNQEMFQEAKRMSNCKDSSFYADTQTIKSFAQTVEDFMLKKELSGIFLFVMLPNDNNMFDQKRLQIMLIKHNVRVKRVTIQDMVVHVTRNEENNIFYKGQLVSFVYYRAGYRYEHFQHNGDPEAGWKTKEIIELSNAYTLPPIVMEIVNQKRVQTELTKPEVLRKFLSDEQARELEKTFVQQWQFDTMSEDQYKDLICQVQKAPQRYILKPNREGGGNNFYGTDALAKMKKLSLKECRIFILMEKIMSKPTKNAIMDGENYKIVDCLYEISRIGAFSWIDDKLNKNNVSGFLVRAKPEHANEGGIMTGIGSIVTWKLINK